MTLENEERIARYLDGEMEASEREAFELDLDNDPALAERCAAWQRQDRAVTADFDALLGAKPMSVPAALRKAEGGVTDLASARRARTARRLPVAGHWRWSMPAALAAGVAGLMLVSPMIMRTAGDSHLELLESTPSGQTVALADGRRLDVVLTFAAADGRWCREFTLSDGARGIACRDQGVWQSEVQVAQASAQSAGDEPGGYAAAGASEDAAIEEAYARLAGDIPLGAEDETQLIENRWTALAR